MFAEVQAAKFLLLVHTHAQHQFQDEEQYTGKLECEILDATTPESVEQIKGYGFGNHGMVIFDSEGKVQKKMDGHMMQEPQIRQALKEVMGGA